jgi:hypothetical protein
MVSGDSSPQVSKVSTSVSSCCSPAGRRAVLDPLAVPMAVPLAVPLPPPRALYARWAAGGCMPAGAAAEVVGASSKSAPALLLLLLPRRDRGSGCTGDMADTRAGDCQAGRPPGADSGAAACSMLPCSLLALL